MKRFIEKPHLFFLAAVPLLLITGILSGNTTLNLNLHDTYFVIPYLYLTLIASMLFGIIGITYWVMKKAKRKLSIWLNGIHIAITMGGIITILVLTQFYSKRLFEHDFDFNLSQSISIIAVLIICCQILFPINLIYGMINKEIKTSG